MKQAGRSLRREQLIRRWEQLICEKTVGLSEKSYHFSESPTTFLREQLSRDWLQLIRNCISLSPAHE